MKNQYFGDINDYLKYGILLELSGGGSLRTGVCWMLTDADGRTDGSALAYLHNPDVFRGYAPAVFDLLHRAVIVDTDRRVSRLEESAVLPRADYYSAILRDQQTERARYFQGANARLADSDWVFFDPDNGLEIPSIPIGRKNSSKFLYWQEVEAIYRAGKSVLIYQHFPRAQRVPYTQAIAAKLGTRTGIATAFSFRTTRVVFLLAPQPSHIDHFRPRAAALSSTWGDLIAVSEHQISETAPLA